VAGVTQRRYFEALARGADEVSSTAALQNEFLRRPTRVPITGFSETWRRLRALTVRRDDGSLERLRKQAIASIVVSLGAFLWILLAMTMHI
jgi:hypothetical protein